jgi:6-phosphogluconate dehydrogenase
MKIGYVGLGRMGKNMVLHLLEQGIEVVAWNRSPEPREEVAKAGATAVETVEELVNTLRKAQGDKPKIIWLMLPAGDTTDEFIDKLLPLLDKGDLLIDGGNSFYKDTLRRAEKIKPTGIRFMDIGTSGGPGGARTGACLMIGGDKTDYEEIKELVVAASSKDAYGHFGPVGAGHFAKMVHNGVEYGMMEAISEGAAILKNAPFPLDLQEIFRVYNNRSVVESRLVGWALDALKEDPELKEYSSVVGHTGEGEWTAKTAQELKVDADVIKRSFEIRVESDKVEENSPNGYRNKMTSAMRGKFGQHAVKKDS